MDFRVKTLIYPCLGYTEARQLTRAYRSLLSPKAVIKSPRLLYNYTNSHPRDNTIVLCEAAQSVIDSVASRPPATEVVSVLLDLEKSARTDKVRYSFEQLIGSWRLSFITGTKKTRARAGIVLGAGRYVPRFVKIQLDYSTAPVGLELQDEQMGRVENRVTIGALDLVLTGPTKFLSHKNILAFDFTKMIVQLFGVTLYSGYIPGGRAKEEGFYSLKVSKQAFFAYFFISDRAIAARGRGGGLALWGR